LEHILENYLAASCFRLLKSKPQVTHYQPHGLSFSVLDSYKKCSTSQLLQRRLQIMHRPVTHRGINPTLLWYVADYILQKKIQLCQTNERC